MEYGAPVHWGCMAAASFILSCMTMVSWDARAAARICRRLAGAAESYALSLAPVAALAYTLYVVSCGS
jgi:hypothetical protein